jgi:UPF0148 protein
MDEKTDASVKKMAEMLRRGATMLAQACPQCGSPLMRVGNDIYCATCDRRIVVVKEGQQAEPEALRSLIPGLRETLIRKLKKLNELIDKEENAEALAKLAGLMLLLLQALQQLENVK